MPIRTFQIWHEPHLGTLIRAILSFPLGQTENTGFEHCRDPSRPVHFADFWKKIQEFVSTLARLELTTTLQLISNSFPIISPKTCLISTEPVLNHPFSKQAPILLSEWLYNTGQNVQKFWQVHFQFSLKINTKYPASKLTIWPKLTL